MSASISIPTLILPTGEMVAISPENDSDFSYDEVARHVGTPIEVVNISPDLIFLINEKGKIYGMPYNAKATEIAHQARALFPQDYIAGPALFCGDEQFR